MILILCFFVLAVLHGVQSQAGCVPEAVGGLQLNYNSTLLWQPSTNCDDTSYLIYTITQDTVTHFFQVYDTWLDVSFLPACEFFRFVVVAVAYTDLSAEAHLDTRLPAEPDANLTVSHLIAIPQGESGVLLEWELDEKFAHCAQYFRVARWDGEGVPIDTYTTTDYILLDGLAPCTQFVFTVTPIYNDALEGGVGLIAFETAPHTAHTPYLESVRPGTTYADMTWNLPSYVQNRCPITSLVVDGSPYINMSIPITDSRERPPINVHITPLLTDRMYLFRVYMINSGGASTPYPVAIQTLPDTITN